MPLLRHKYPFQLQQLESEKSTRLSQNRIGERERLKSESQLEARRVRLRFLASDGTPL